MFVITAEKEWEIQGWSSYNDMTFITSLTGTCL